MSSFSPKPRRPPSPPLRALLPPLPEAARPALRLVEAGGDAGPAALARSTASLNLRIWMSTCGEEAG